MRAVIVFARPTQCTEDSTTKSEVSTKKSSPSRTAGGIAAGRPRVCWAKPYLERAMGIEPTALCLGSQARLTARQAPSPYLRRVHP